MVSLDKITTNGKTVFLAYDQGMEHGPSDFDDQNVDPNYVLQIGTECAFNAVIFQKGIAEKYYTGSQYATKIPLIVKLNGKTGLVTENDPYSPQICTVEEALSLGAVAVGYTIYIGSEFEQKMFAEFAQIERDAHAKDIPTIVWMYPRGKATEGKEKKDLIAYGGRVALELGADMVKLHYPGNQEAMKWVVEAAGKTKVVVAGGVKATDEDFLALVKSIMDAGACGMAVGRNIWQSKDPGEISKKIKDIVFAKQ